MKGDAVSYFIDYSIWEKLKRVVLFQGDDDVSSTVIHQ